MTLHSVPALPAGPQCVPAGGAAALRAVLQAMQAVLLLSALALLVPSQGEWLSQQTAVATSICGSATMTGACTCRHRMLCCHQSLPSGLGYCKAQLKPVIHPLCRLQRLLQLATA